MQSVPPSALITAVLGALADMDAEYAQMPFFLRPMVRRGFAKRTGADLDGWRDRLGQLARGVPTTMGTDLLALAEHFRGAPARAQRGMGATAAQLVEVQARADRRAAAVMVLHASLLRPA